MVHDLADAGFNVKLTVLMTASVFTVCAFVHHEQDALFTSNLLQTVEVKFDAVDWLLLEAPVTGVENRTNRGTNNNRCRIRNRVIHPHQLNTKVGTKLYAFVRLWIHDVID